MFVVARGLMFVNCGWDLGCCVLLFFLLCLGCFKFCGIVDLRVTGCICLILLFCAVLFGFNLAFYWLTVLIDIRVCVWWVFGLNFVWGGGFGDLVCELGLVDLDWVLR